VRDIQPAAGHFKIEIGGDEQFIADRAARGLYVRREPRAD
jgi:DtxR family Mn-dependent transcriptional regulator